MRIYGPEVAEVADQLVEVYGEVFTVPPWNEGAGAAEEYRERLEADRLRPGFRVAVAASGGEVDGYASGWTTPDPFPAERAYGRVAAQAGARRTEQLLVGAFQVDELAVRERARRTGLGRRLLEAILAAAAPNGRAWLLTGRNAPEAMAFYRRCGWHEVAPVPGADGGEVAVFLAPGHPDASDSGYAQDAQAPR
ncbi:GNAT family N-acetyltransferase [Streptomyces sp. NPDC058657]|uniref:GNAT family N-acetyltransferase n=1 Tax=unclassified Streptomyces TaxID=2593676 RepID=UPI00366473F7